MQRVYVLKKSVFYLSLGIKIVGVDCVVIDLSRLILVTVVLSAPHHQPHFVSRLGTGTGTIFGSCGEVSGCA